MTCLTANCSVLRSQYLNTSTALCAPASEEGKIYDPQKVPAALRNFFRADNLLQPRQLAGREGALLLGRQIELEAGGTAPVGPERRDTDRLLACVNAHAAAREIIRKTSRLADRLAAAWYVLYVQTPREAADRIGLATQRHLLQNLQLAAELGAQILRVKDPNVVGAIQRVARQKHATLLVCGVTGEKRLWERIRRRGVTQKPVRAVVHSNAGLDIYLVSY